jgi:WSC domain
MTCSGNLSEYCGGNSRLDVYNFNNAIATITTSATPTGTGAPTQTPSIKQTVGNYSYFGCQTEGNATRALDGAATSSDTMTLEVCEAFCGAFTYWGTEYGRECELKTCFSV